MFFCQAGLQIPTLALSNTDCQRDGISQNVNYFFPFKANDCAITTALLEKQLSSGDSPVPGWKNNEAGCHWWPRWPAITLYRSENSLLILA